MMTLYLCRVCGYFRDINPIPFMISNTTHCPNDHGLMYQVQKGDRLAVVIQDDEEEEKKCGCCGEAVCKHCGQCCDPGCYEYEPCEEEE